MTKIETCQAGGRGRGIYEAPEVEVCFLEPEKAILIDSNIFTINDWDDGEYIGGGAE